MRPIAWAGRSAAVGLLCGGLASCSWRDPPHAGVTEGADSSSEGADSSSEGADSSSEGADSSSGGTMGSCQQPPSVSIETPGGLPVVWLPHDPLVLLVSADDPDATDEVTSTLSVVGYDWSTVVAGPMLELAWNELLAALGEQFGGTELTFHVEATDRCENTASAELVVGACLGSPDSGGHWDWCNGCVNLDSNENHCGACGQTTEDCLPNCGGCFEGSCCDCACAAWLAGPQH